LQRVAVRCSTFTYVEKSLTDPKIEAPDTLAVSCSALQCVEVCCSVLQCVATCCIVLQCVAVCCSVLQCVEV